MIDTTPVARRLLEGEIRRQQRYSSRQGAERVQLDVLRSLLRTARGTAFAAHWGIDRASGPGDFASRVPMADYPAFRPWIDRMVRGERDVLWPGVCRRFAQSSGTSDGKSKYIPVTDDSLRLNHYAGARSSLANYLHLYRESRLLSGKNFILGGSFANEIGNLPAGVKVGDLSAHLIDRISPLANLVRVPRKEIALMADWTEKLPALVEASMGENITGISGVPSWFLTVLRHVVGRAGASTIHDVWPNLEVFFHGGISFTPYREQYAAITDPARMRYLENYNASEGFFAMQDTVEPGSMLLLLDKGVFYEFVEPDSLGEPFPRARRAWEVEQGATYALVITACNGLWRYIIGDTVTIESCEPLRISIAGRTRSFINAFGEEVMVHNTDAAIEAACRATGAQVADYTVAPVMADGNRHGHHQWLIEWHTPPASREQFADMLDRALQDENSDYQAKRAGSIFLDRLTITDAPAGVFDRWLASTGKLGGQRKVPRLCNDRHIIDGILRLMNNRNIPTDK